MQIRMIETFLVEADSLEEAEQAYVNGDYLGAELISTEFEEKEKEVMEDRKVELTLKEYTDLMVMANYFELLKAAAKKDSYLSELEKTIFGLHEEPTEEEDF